MPRTTLPSSCALQHAHWRASHQALLCLDLIAHMNIVVAGSRDHNVTLWTLEGAIVGILGACLCARVCVCVCECVCVTH